MLTFDISFTLQNSGYTFTTTDRHVGPRTNRRRTIKRLYETQNGRGHASHLVNNGDASKRLLEDGGPWRGRQVLDQVDVIETASGERYCQGHRTCVSGHSLQARFDYDYCLERSSEHL